MALPLPWKVAVTVVSGRKKMWDLNLEIIFLTLKFNIGKYVRYSFHFSSSLVTYDSIGMTSLLFMTPSLFSFVHLGDL